ncbi:metal ABC transporter permease [bacterium]|nr:metal ABC transporter permease [bacterium]
MVFVSIFGPIMLAALLGGGTAGLLGVFIVGMRMPFIAVFSAHAALAGAVFGVLMGFPSEASAFIGALSGAVILGMLLRNRDIDPNAALGSLFSLMLGIAFLGIGLSEGPKSSMLGLLWGSLLFVTRGQLLIMAVMTVVLITFISIFRNELKALMFSRELAALIIPEWMIFILLLILSAGVITINLEIVGGLLLYSLISNPAVAAIRLARNFRTALILSSVFGAASALGGFGAAYWFDLPVGACIVLVSSLIVGISFAATRS